jgi:hypothetical protein
MSLIKDTKVRLRLLDANTTANAESDTLYVGNWAMNSVHIINPGGETVQVFKSLDDPNVNDVVQNWVQHGEDITDTAAFVVINECIRYIKVVRGAGVSAVTAIIQSGARIIT